MSQDDDPSFAVLPARIRRRIDRVFDDTCLQSHPRISKSARSIPASGGFIIDVPESSTSHIAPGGFLLDDDEPAGGFLPGDSTSRLSSPDDEEEQSPAFHESHSQLPLSQIPIALQLLDLPPDDEDVLAVFRNAASGWAERATSAKLTDEGPNDDEKFVSRKDWRAVCAALLDVGEGSDSGDMDEDIQMQQAEESELSEEEYQDSNESDHKDSEDDASDEDYQQTGKSKTSSSRKRGKKARKTSRRVEDSDEDMDGGIGRPMKITPRQKAECRRAFALFFPDTKDEDLDKQKLMIKDINRVSALLKEKITAQETVEMVEEYSTSVDKSISLADFEHIMLQTRLV